MDLKDMMISGGKILGNDEAPYDIENPYEPLLEESDNLFPLSPFLCIYRVPELLRKGNEKAYTPRVVSIGPIHHGHEHLKAVEEHKRRYLLDFLSRTMLSLNDCIKMTKEKEGRLRASYAEQIKFDSDKFVRIVLVDAAFVIGFLLRCYSSKFGGEEDPVFPGMSWDLLPDLLLLENQLPFFIIRDLFNKAFSNSPRQLPSLLQISYFSFDGEINSKGKEKNFNKICSSGEEVQHFVDLIRILYQPLEPKTRREPKTTAVPNVTELRQAGVKFTVGEGGSLFDIKFSDGTLFSGGTLEMPKLLSNATLKNALAFELCHPREEKYLTNYVFLMKRLAKTPRDVELLVEYGIIDNWLGDTQKIAAFLLEFGTGVMVTDHYYANLYTDLNRYCRSRRNRWMENLRQDYFNTPWSIISVVAAVILLVLTFIQTLCSIISIA